MTEPAQKSARAQVRSLVGIVAFLGKYPRRAAFCVLLLLINIAIEMTLPQILGNAITHLRWHVEWGLAFALGPAVQLFLSLVLVRAGVGYILGPARNRLVQDTLGDIRAAIYDAIQRLAFPYHDKSNTGELISRSTTDIWRLQDFLYACLFLSIDIAVSLVATTWLILAISPALGAVSLAILAPTIALISFYAGKLQPRWRQVHDLHGAMTTVIQENIAGVRVVKAFAKESAEVQKFSRKREAFLTTLTETVNYWASRIPVAQFLFGLGLPLVLWLGGREVIQGRLLLGDLAKVVFYLMAIGHRVGLIGQFTNILQNASASAERILEVIHEPQLIKSGKVKLPPGAGEVVFERVSFNYQKGKASLTEVSFTAEPGKTYAIVGPTGSGKSTLVNLIPRFYDASGGRVLVDGCDVRDLDLRQLRRSMGVIFQETFLFSATVAENITYGQPQATPEEIERAARAAQAHEFICELEEGYRTVIGERGVTLSGGQKQRLAIARAFLMNPRILILDDATASVDSHTERLIQEALVRLCAGRTTFVIAHRFSTVQHADQILVLKEGRIVERGR
ncbi:MAG: ABC transporter ATP-binding protein, partial [Chloroflexi bacterium]|nr:ABC transporter ATP-binding protein [Chloroflexota bacterium]